MEVLTEDLIRLFYDLLPGFLAAWVYYGLTPHEKPSPFERVIQALIFTVIVRALFIVFQKAVLVIWDKGSPEWLTTENGSLVLSVVIAVAIGLVFAKLTNNDSLHRWARKLRLTRQTSFPSEWYSAFAREARWVVLHLRGERRLYGWPEEWPDSPEQGHFLITQPEWLLEDGSRAPSEKVELLLVPATEVEMVEFIKYDGEMSTIHTEPDHGSQSSTTSTQPTQ